jgi:hypothetical protein
MWASRRPAVRLVSSAVGESGEGVTQKIAAGGHEFRIAGERDSGVFRETW